MAKRKPTKGKQSGKKRRPAQPAARKASPSAPPAASAGGSVRKPTRSERIDVAQAEQQRRRRRTRALVYGAVGVALFAIVGSQVAGKLGAASFRNEVTSGSCSFDTRSDPTDPEPNNHVASPFYEVNPPAGGNHLLPAAEPGIYGADDLPPDGELVHALEHGYLIFWYRPDVAAGQREALEDVAGEYPRDVLVAARVGMPTQVAATAWGKRLLCEKVEPVALRKLVERYREQGPENVPH